MCTSDVRSVLHHEAPMESITQTMLPFLQLCWEPLDRYSHFASTGKTKNFKENLSNNTDFKTFLSEHEAVRLHVKPITLPCSERLNY